VVTLSRPAFRDWKSWIIEDPDVSVAIERNGKFHSGDLAVLDEEGRCNITGKAKEVIRGGENICTRCARRDDPDHT
jgi:fatty-acyl-CoA synthase